MAAGTGLYALTLGATFIIITGQFILHSPRIDRRNTAQMFLIKFDYKPETVNYVKKTFLIDKFSRFKIGSSGGMIVVKAVIRTEGNFSADDLALMMQHHKNIHSIERLEDL
jgi:uncharacterized membrane protein YhiD involved in acid resistance